MYNKLDKRTAWENIYIVHRCWLLPIGEKLLYSCWTNLHVCFAADGFSTWFELIFRMSKRDLRHTKSLRISHWICARCQQCSVCVFSRLCSLYRRFDSIRQYCTCTQVIQSHWQQYLKAARLRQPESNFFFFLLYNIFRTFSSQSIKRYTQSHRENTDEINVEASDEDGKKTFRTHEENRYTAKRVLLHINVRRHTSRTVHI